MIKELDEIVLTSDIPEYRLQAGDLGTVVDVHPSGREYTVEFFTLEGKTVAIIPLAPDQIRPIASGEIASARVLNR
ncbi:MAG: DUF4926 domain-containing protein [Chloroflexi bacterium]|nr:DUF4926 domain-containing protein [Chloroflexota bacterium]NOG62225.1 DUF4926 domain-containing protein [Chloroflexota bacterium]